MANSEGGIFQLNKIWPLNLNPIVSAWPSNFAYATSLKIEVYSGARINLKPCQTYDIPTNIELECMIPLTHNVCFKGHSFMEHVKVMDKFIFPVGQNLKVQVTNYNIADVLLHENTPLGILILKQNR